MKADVACKFSNSFTICLQYRRSMSTHVILIRYHDHNIIINILILTVNYANKSKFSVVHVALVYIIGN